MSVITGENIKKLREGLNLSQAGLAQMVTMSQPHLSDLEKGGYIRESELNKIAAALKVSISKIMPDTAAHHFNISSHDTSQQTNLNGNITLTLPLETFMDLIKKFK